MPIGLIIGKIISNPLTRMLVEQLVSLALKVGVPAALEKWPWIKKWVPNIAEILDAAWLLIKDSKSTSKEIQRGAIKIAQERAKKRYGVGQKPEIKRV